MTDKAERDGTGGLPPVPLEGELTLEKTGKHEKNINRTIINKRLLVHEQA